MNINPAIPLQPFDPEPERTLHARLREQRLQQGILLLLNMENETVDNTPTDAPTEMDERDRVIGEVDIPLLHQLNASIIRPDITTPHFELKPVMFQMLQTMG